MSQEKYRLAVRSAVVAGVFSAAVAAILVYQFAQRGDVDPLHWPEYQKLRAELAQQPQDEAVKEQIREFDLAWRHDYFRQRRFVRTGAWLLLGGLAVLLVAVKSAVTLGQRPPMPTPSGTPHDTETRTMAAARWSVAGLGVVLVGAAAFVVYSVQDLNVGIQPPSPPVAAGGISEPQTPSAPAPTDFPTDEELLANWPQFRGPGGRGISTDAGVPTDWDGPSGKGIVWKTPVPLAGNNSPVVWGDRVFLSGATDEKREVYCFDAGDGKLLWQQEVPGGPSAAANPPEVNEETGYAAPTTATDGRRVYAIFATGDVAAFDFDGHLAWTRNLGVPKSMYGYAASLTTFRHLLLIQFDQGSAKDSLSKMIALDGTTGETAWETARDVANSWSSPIVIRTAGGDYQLIAAGAPWVIAYDPADGRELWRSKSLEGDVGPSPVFANETVYVANQFPALSAIKVDAASQGDVTETHVLWQGEDDLPDTASPVATSEFVLTAASYGVLTCYAAADGEMLWYEEFDDATFTSSPSLVGDRLYLFSAEGKAFVVKPSREGCQRIAEPDLGEECVTSPAFHDGRMYIRGKEHLFCIGSG